MKFILNTDSIEYFFCLSKNLNFIFNNATKIKENVQYTHSTYSKVEKENKKYLKVWVFSVKSIRGGGKKRKKKIILNQKKLNILRKK